MGKKSIAKNKLSPIEKVVAGFITSFSKGNPQKILSYLAKNVTSYITNADAGVNKLRGHAAFLTSIPDDIGKVKPTVNITQCLSVKRNQVLTMVEVKARRKGKNLHNHAAFLMTVKNSKIIEIWMVDALPAYSDKFWKN